MNNKQKLISTAMTALLGMVTAPSALATSIDSSSKNSEKCYGIVKTGMNDCATAKSSCAGSSTKDRQLDAFLFVPKGLCEKISGGSLTAGTDTHS